LRRKQNCQVRLVVDDDDVEAAVAVHVADEHRDGLLGGIDHRAERERDVSVGRHEDTILLVPTALQYDFLRSDPRLKAILARAGL
jgi:hypothetical protein